MIVRRWATWYVIFIATITIVHIVTQYIKHKNSIMERELVSLMSEGSKDSMDTVDGKAAAISHRINMPGLENIASIVDDHPSSSGQNEVPSVLHQDNLAKENPSFQRDQHHSTRQLISLSPIKRILYWTGYWNGMNWGFGYGREPFIKNSCLIDKCVTTGDKSLLNSSDAVLIHYTMIKDVSGIPPYRDPHQYWVYINKEAPYWKGYLQNISLIDNIFNLTMTHRPDSDIPLPYGRVLPLSREERLKRAKVPSRNYAENKTDLVAWFVSNCITPSEREHYVKELQKFINVDIYGKCGPLSCDRYHADCDEMLEKRYKFYLAFENTLCDHYVTEKLWRPLRLRIVPIVYGAADYESFLPRHSFINVKDFKSISHLADYLLELDKNDTMYNEYFEWKKFHTIDYLNRAQPFCDLCAYLHQAPQGHSKVIYDLGKWYGTRENCYSPRLYFNITDS